MSTKEQLATFERFKSEMSSMDDSVLVLLKGHLLIEEALTSVIDLHVYEREHVDSARLSFIQKFSLARALGLRKARHGEWELISAINALRNDMAHNLTSPKRIQKMAHVKALYLREAKNMDGLTEIVAEGEIAILFSACGHCVGFLSALAADSRALRGFVYTLDRSLNPDLPPFDI